jgi:hypothetical protein
VTTAGHSSASKYLAIALSGNNRLEIDFDQLSGRDRDRLSGARADLADASATERLFDRRLLMIAFPSAVKMIAEDLVRRAVSAVRRWNSSLSFGR